MVFNYGDLFFFVNDYYFKTVVLIGIHVIELKSEMGSISYNGQRTAFPLMAKR